MAKQRISKRDLLERIAALEQEVAEIKGATHEHSISPETILHLANIVAADIKSQQEAAIEEEIASA